jgi:uncharacterized hydantoinase/oxoprolinase family protein
VVVIVTHQDQRLKEAVNMYGEEDWERVAAYVGKGRMPEQCLRRWKRYVCPDAEDQRLVEPRSSKVAFYFDKETVRNVPTKQ